MHYYDDLGRGVKSYIQHYLGGTLNNSNYDALITTFNFTNVPTTVTRQHFNIANPTTPLVTLTNTYFYDHLGRKLSAWELITNGTTQTTKTLLSKLVYNEMGQLLTKNLHSTDSTTYLQNIAYSYNERGWLLGSTAGLFQMYLQYNSVRNVTGITPVAQYNGNIASQSWGTAAAPNTTSFVYTYDKLNRLLSGTGTTGYRESNIAYDMMGNINRLVRYDPTVSTSPIDNLVYTYTDANSNYTNQVQKVQDNSTVTTTKGLANGPNLYQWDGNGNLAISSNTANNTQNKSFIYNLLNLPQTVTLPTGTATYTYDATGNKLRKVSVLGGVTTTTDYINGIEYDNSTTVIGFIQTEEGKAVPNSTTNYDYNYYLGDNLGNTRITFGTKTSAAVVYQQDDYYPFDMEILHASPVPIPKNEYLYNKKELQEELELYDYGARFYDPVAVHWTSVDPMAEMDRRWSPYNYVLDNPLRFEDPDGMRWKDKTKDQAIADRLQGEIVDRLSDEGNIYNDKAKEISEIESEINAKGETKKLKDRLVKANNELSEINQNISNLESASLNLSLMGDDNQSQVFDFNDIQGQSREGQTYNDNGVITMDFVNDANAMHESTHGIQLMDGVFTSKGKDNSIYPEGQEGLFKSEMEAYSMQYSFDPSSVQKLPSYEGSVSQLSDIKRSWILGITNSNGDYQYGKIISPNRKVIKKYADDLKSVGQ